MRRLLFSGTSFKGKQYHLLKHFFFEIIWVISQTGILKGFGQRIYISNFWVAFSSFYAESSTGWKFVIYGSAVQSNILILMTLFYESLCYTDETIIQVNNISLNHYMIFNVWHLHNSSARFVTVQDFFFNVEELNAKYQFLRDTSHNTSFLLLIFQLPYMLN